jgi:heme A synthase
VRQSGRFHKFSGLVLVATLGVILWGAYVRASGSGAGCGSHWPTCNGEVIPRAKSVETVIEFTHRATSGIAFLLVVAQLVWALRAFGRGHPVRAAAVASMALMVTEAIVGAGLVIFEMVAGNTSTARAAWMAAHLMNTFALLAAMGLTWWLSRPGGAEAPAQPLVAAPGPSWRSALLAGLAVLLFVAASGAIVALGDTLFPAASLREGLAQDFSPTAHLFVRLRVVHPVLAVAGGIYLLLVTGLLAARDVSGRLRRQATTAAALVMTQLAAGVLNLALLAPTALQIVHLLLADLVWLALVCLTAAVWRSQPSRAPAAAGVAAPASSP